MSSISPMKSFLFVFFLVLVFATGAHATVTIQFSEPFAGGIPSNFANSAGVITNGMQWGIVVDTTGNGFANSGTSYDAYAAGVTTAGFLGANGSLSDDYYIPGTVTKNGAGLFEGDFTTQAGNGSIVDDLTSIALANGISAGDKFSLVWFSTSTSGAGDRYGYFNDASFLVPADGATTSYGAPFVGNDSPRSATNTFAAISGAPEPSRMLLVGFGALGLMMRRRRSVV